LYGPLIARWARIMGAVASMAVMHENMHQRTSQQNQKWQRTEEVGTVLA